jgi:hypothetical protein
MGGYFSPTVPLKHLKSDKEEAEYDLVNIRRNLPGEKYSLATFEIEFKEV